ncbi:MAG: sigma-54-dependent Fis family transcriptional regulator [Proteobacteria bacterium]|nr:sigma-54-dependent Fis family transcriptional regulator [Pseudomonadota bacterium]
MNQPTALVIDDEPDIRELLSLTLQQMDIKTRTAADLAEARALLLKKPFDLCFTDMKLPDGSGLDLVEWMQEQTPNTPVAVITAHGNVETAVRALKAGAFDFVSKPLDLDGLRKMVKTALRLRSNQTPVDEDHDTHLIGDSMAMQTVRDLIAKVTRSQAPVHICGESGTGKELVAVMIHESGPRRDGPFVPVNCGAIPSELMESEFFGHKKGSFTGAVADKPGLFQSAEGGTLFLDEVAELPLHMQVKLLRVIQEKAVRPVGSEREVPVDVRVLSSTHRNLAELVATGEFREDLFYRIHVIELHVPPLRDRGRDILQLSRFILARLAEQMGLPVPALDADAESALLAHPFPGNVRELENLLERALTLNSGDTIGAADLQLDPGSAKPPEEPDSSKLGSQLEGIEREAIVKALEQTRYNKTRAAKLLGISFRALRYRIKKLKIE